MIEYRDDAALTAKEVIELYERSGLGERRPIDRPDVFQKMIDHADFIVTAWDDGKLVGVARSLTDYGYVAYLADLAVDSAYQRQGIGTALVEETRKLVDESCRIALFAAPDANEYYEKLGFERNPRGWMLKPAQ